MYVPNALETCVDLGQIMPIVTDCSLSQLEETREPVGRANIGPGEGRTARRLAA